MKILFVTLISLILLGLPPLPVAATENAATNQLENLSLELALDLAERLQPELAAARAAVDAAAGRARQVGVFPNPEAILGAQQIPFGSGAPDEREYVAGIGQTLPLGGRLSKARQAELLHREVLLRDLEAKGREVRKRVRAAFATALYQEKALQARNTVFENSVKAVTTTKARVDAGDATRQDLARAEMELARAQVEQQRADSLRRQSLVELASAIGDSSLSVNSLDGALDITFEIPTLEALAANLALQPELAQAKADIRAQSARLDLAKAERIPDVRVELLYHRLHAASSDTLDVGLSIPVPIFNRNQGRLREAKAELTAAEARSRLTQNELSTRLRQAHLQLTAALANCRAYKSEVLNRGDTILKSAEARYAVGDISLAEILPVRQDWAAVQLSYLESLRDVMQAWATLLPYAKPPPGR